MSRVCVTRTSRRTSLIPTRSAHVTYRDALVTQPAYLTTVPYTTCSAVTIRSTRTCSSYRTTRVSTVPRQIETVNVPYTVTVQDYITSVSTYYSTSCSTVRGYTTPRHTPTTRTVTVLSTTTDSTDTLPKTVTMVSTITDTTDAPPSSTEPDTWSTTSTDVPSGNTVPVVPVVAGVVGGIAGAALLGLLIYFLCFRKSSRASRKEWDNNQVSNGGALYDTAQDGQLQQQDGQGVQYGQPTASTQHPQYSEMIWQGYGTYYAGDGAAQTSQTTSMPVAAAGAALYPPSSPSPPPASHASLSPVLPTRQSLASNLSVAPLLPQQQQPYAGGGQLQTPPNTYSSTYRGYGEPQDSR